MNPLRPVLVLAALLLLVGFAHASASPPGSNVSALLPMTGVVAVLGLVSLLARDPAARR